MKSYCTTVGVGSGVSKMLKFYIKVFYVMGKALSGKLSCPCDRSCFKVYDIFTDHCVYSVARPPPDPRMNT